jgi:hypothetical protein
MPYPVYKSNGDLLTTLVDQTIDTSTTSIQLVGRGAVHYGEPFAEDLVHMLEHFNNTVAPAAPLNGQIWFETISKNVRVFDGTNWVLVQGPQIMETGFGAPPSVVGNAGDYFTDLATGNIYGPKITPTTWPVNPLNQHFLMSNGTNPLLCGFGAPTGGIGIDGEFYADLATGRLYGPRASGAWPTAFTSLAKQPIGTGVGVLYSGTTIPSNAIGEDGAWYVQEVTNNVYGPKVSGLWPSTPSGSFGPAFTNGALPPNNPTAGAMWWNPSEGILYVSIRDGLVPVWVDVSSSGIGGGAGAGGGGSGSVVTDSSLSGIGTLSSPLSLNILHDASLVGNGSPSSKLTLNVQTDGSVAGTGSVGSPLTLAINTDASLLGSGSTTHALKLNIQHDASLTGTGSAGSALSVAQATTAQIGGGHIITQASANAANGTSNDNDIDIVTMRKLLALANPALGALKALLGIPGPYLLPFLGTRTYSYPVGTMLIPKVLGPYPSGAITSSTPTSPAYINDQVYVTVSSPAYFYGCTNLAGLAGYGTLLAGTWMVVSPLGVPDGDNYYQPEPMLVIRVA